MTERTKFIKTGGTNERGEELLEAYIHSNWGDLEISTGHITTVEEIQGKIDKLTSQLNKLNRELVAAQNAQPRPKA